MPKLNSTDRQVLLSAIGATAMGACLAVAGCPDLPVSPTERQVLAGASSALAILFASIAIEGIAGRWLTETVRAAGERLRTLVH